ncbi:hypothetical protein LAZ40_13230 [Cereibacter sphaeroides]|uniref:hypothetical protein n=1 Tax=Cereibacter sphaeroides TaxID=1063 RepID=UPI001F3EE5B0|nr:hypothetical protein [Cereibacter sphaeroides]MCE6959984.1 hypothetical protein [Cereibacter sphaeroides]MCE6973069.1 hypothetical protein [Cereibacter sphaeroides]
MADHCHNTLGLPSASLPAAVSQRATLAVPVALAALAPAFTGVPALAHDDTPVMRLCRKWEAMRAAEDTVWNEVSEATLEAMIVARSTLEARILKTPSECAADFAAKLVAFTCWGECVLSDAGAGQIWDDARTLLGRA